MMIGARILFPFGLLLSPLVALASEGSPVPVSAEAVEPGTGAVPQAPETAEPNAPETHEKPEGTDKPSKLEAPAKDAESAETGAPKSADEAPEPSGPEETSSEEPAREAGSEEAPEEPPSEAGPEEAGSQNDSSTDSVFDFRDPSEVRLDDETDSADRDEENDNGRWMQFFWLNAEAGAEYIGLAKFETREFGNAALVRDAQFGPMGGIAAGFQLGFLTLGARFRSAHFSDFDTWTLNGEVGVRIPIAIVEPHFVLGGGFASLGDLKLDKLSTKSGIDNVTDVDIHGWNVRGGFGVDVYLTNNVTVGVLVMGDALFLFQDAKASIPANIQTGLDEAGEPELDSAAEEIAELDGTSIGGSASATVSVGLRF